MKKKYSLKEIRLKILGYCAKQERCHKDVRSKLLEYGTRGDEVDELIAYLIENNFLNEGRFACLYARSKFNQNNWGRTKIKQGLKQRFISEYCIKEALLEIDEGEYLTTAKLLMDKKRSLISEKNPLVIKQKLTSYMVQKGYEYNLVAELMRTND